MTSVGNLLKLSRETELKLSGLEKALRSAIGQADKVVKLYNRISAHVVLLQTRKGISDIKDMFVPGSPISPEPIQENLRTHEPVPRPIHEPDLLPTFLLNVFKNTHPPDGPGLIYEATVDRLVLLNSCGRFKSQKEKPAQRAPAADDVDDLSVDINFNPPAFSTPPRREGSEQRQLSVGPAASTDLGHLADLDINTSDSDPDEDIRARGNFVPTPPVDGPSALPDSVGVDMLNPLVHLAQESIRRPDVSIVYQGVPGAMGVPAEKTICMAENKLKDTRAAVDQLRGYAKEYGQESSRVCDSLHLRWPARVRSYFAGKLNETDLNSSK
ncbi:hypothetical protein B0H14DRAFT_3139033 [Mycena olivaceomarginata]|nr:hypothetical protein B0H14DRAFT_3139033 [Mycena olivaceomarginata]